MDVPLEPSLSNIAEGTEQPGHLAGRPLDEWNAAYGKVELYFHALRVRNKILLNRLVILVLKRAMRRAPAFSISAAGCCAMRTRWRWAAPSREEENSCILRAPARHWRMAGVPPGRASPGAARWLRSHPMNLAG